MAKDEVEATERFGLEFGKQIELAERDAHHIANTLLRAEPGDMVTATAPDGTYVVFIIRKNNI